MVARTKTQLEQDLRAQVEHSTRLATENAYLRDRVARLENGGASSHVSACALHLTLRDGGAVANLLHTSDYDPHRALATMREFGEEFDTLRLNIVRVMFNDPYLMPDQAVVRPYLFPERRRS